MYLINGADTQMVKSVGLGEWQCVTARARIRGAEHSRGKDLLNWFPVGLLWFPVLIFTLEKQA